MFQLGGYLPLIKSYIGNTFTLDEHRSLLVALQSMNTPRAEFATIYFKGNIYVLGGEGLVEGDNKTQQVKSLDSVEMYSIENDTWSTITPFTKARQNFSVCSFNDKFLFLFGGKCLKSGNSFASGPKPYEYV